MNLHLRFRVAPGGVVLGEVNLMPAIASPLNLAEARGTISAKAGPRKSGAGSARDIVLLGRGGGLLGAKVLNRGLGVVVEGDGGTRLLIMSTIAEMS